MRVSVLPMVTSLSGVALYLPLVLFFVFKLDYGIYGFGIVTVIISTLQIIVLQICIRCSHQFKDALFWPRRDSLEGWSEYLAISLPTCLMLCAEWWFFEIMIILAGTMGVI